MWCAAVACCARGSCCVAVGSGPGLANVHCEWCQANNVAVGGNAGAARGRRRGQVNCGGSWGVRWPFVCSVRRCAECVCHGLDALCGNCAVVCRWQAGAVVQRRLVGGVGTRETNGCENVLCVRRRALLGGEQRRRQLVNNVHEKKEEPPSVSSAFRSLNCYLIAH